MNENKDEMIRVFNFGNIKLDMYEENCNQTGSWVNWGKDNLWPQYLNELRTKSPEHAAVLGTKAQMIAGNGWNKEGLSDKALLFLQNLNNELDLDEIAARLASGLSTYNGFNLNIRWSKDREKIAEINYVDPSTVRIKKPDLRGEDDRQGYWLCDDWRSPRKNTPVLYPGYSYVDRSEQSQILYVKEYTEGCEYYTLPDYYSGITYIEMEHAIAEFYLSCIKRGFHPSLMINFPYGQPNKEMMDGVISRLRAEYEGSANAGKVIFTFSDGQDNAPTITPITSDDNDKKYESLNGHIENGIFRSHRVNNPALFGVKTPGELGNTNEILDSLSAFQAMYIEPRQRLIEKTITRLARVNGIQDNFYLNKYKLKLEMKMDAGDILAILQSTITTQQKKNVFVSLGYTPEQADELVKNDTI